MQLTKIALSIAAFVGVASAHTITFNSNCPSNYLQLPGIGTFTKTGTYTYSQDINGGIASGGPSCTQDGVGCPSVEFTLKADGSSTADITLISPHKSTSKANFHLTPGGSGATCNSASCGSSNAFFQPTDYSAQRYDRNSNAGIVINFTC